MAEESKSLTHYVLDVMGCKVNQYDAQLIARLLEGFGLQKAEKGRADLIVVHTCGVTAMAVKKSRHAFRTLVRKNPDAVAFLTGCAAAEEIIDGVDGVDARIVAGAGWVQNIADALHAYSLPNPDFRLPENPDELAAESFGGHKRAFLKIQDGCDAGCAYCIVPQLRKAPRDKSIVAAVAEAEALIKRGYREIVIAGVHVGLYGRDGEGSLAEVLRRICAIEQMGRIRMSSLHPAELTDELLAVWARFPQMMPHLHLSLQSGSDSVLARMGRGSSANEYFDAVHRARVALDQPAITTDVIVGFPGETEAEFEETVAFCRRVGFADMHIFSYSKRPGTPAANMPNQVSSPIAHERLQRLGELSREMKTEFNRALVGRPVNVLVESCRDGICKGGSERYVSTSFPGSEEQVGSVVAVSVKSASERGLVGERL